MIDVNKSRRPMCAFWEALRRTRCRDMHMTPEQARLVRNYNRKLSVDSMKKRVINSAVTLGIYTRGINHDNPLQDACEALLRMNDNDIYNAVMYKSKKLRQYNPEELADTFESDELHAFRLLDEETGEIFDHEQIKNITNEDLENEFKKNILRIYQEPFCLLL